MKNAKENSPLAEEKMVHDRFHIMKIATEAVDKCEEEDIVAWLNLVTIGCLEQSIYG
jgi:hypothetical protein